jgi:LacI family transcriptional regulator
MRGYERACVEHGLPVIRHVGAPTAGAMSEAAGWLLDEHPGITACIAPQDQSVIGLFRAAADRAIKVPTDLSVVAMLDESLAELATPPLTTISFPSDELGRAAARILLDRLDRGRPGPDQVLVTPKLVRRGTTAPPRG